MQRRQLLKSSAALFTLTGLEMTAICPECKSFSLIKSFHCSAVKQEDAQKNS
jgi:hypothetical protein